MALQRRQSQIKDRQFFVDQRLFLGNDLKKTKRCQEPFLKDKKVSGTVSAILATFSHFVDEYLAVVQQPRTS